MANNSWQVIDTDLVAGNIKSWVEIFGVLGTYVWWWGVPAGTTGAHYIWAVTIYPWVTNNPLYASYLWSIQYWWNLFMFWYINTTFNNNLSNVTRMFKLDLTTGLITEYNDQTQMTSNNWYSLKYDWTVVYFNSVDQNANLSFDLNGWTWRIYNAWQHAGWVVPTNSETIWLLTYQSMQYADPYNQDTHYNTWKTWFLVT